MAYDAASTIAPSKSGGSGGVNLRALIVTPIYPGPDDPQSGIFIHRQICNLARQGVKCQVLHYRPAPPPFPRWTVSRTWVRHHWKHLFWSGSMDGIPITHAYYERTWAKDEDTVPAIGRALVRHVAEHPELQQTDVVYAHFLWTAGAAALSLRERFGWPVVAIARGSEMNDWQDVHKHCRDYVSHVSRESDGVLANCYYLQQRAEDITPGVKNRVQVVYNGCDSQLFAPTANRLALRNRLGLDVKARWLTFCGRIEKRKGIKEMAEAWTQFAAGHPDWRFLIIGREVEENLVTKLRDSVPGRVHFTGHIAARRVLQYLQVSDAYIHPSQIEGLPNAVMEAMAVGLPVITTDACGQRELIRQGENGWLVPLNDPTALCQALTELAADPQRAARYGQAARHTIEQDFNPITQAQKLRQLLEQYSRRKVEAVRVAG